jgi:glycosyltransferase involved in cell wall biosynthesis
MWSHYKAKVFSELAKLQDIYNFELLVVQMATTEKLRSNLGAVDLSIHQYPYKLLFEAPLEKISWYKMSYSTIKTMLATEFDVMVIPGYAYLFCWLSMIIVKAKSKKVVMSFDSTENDHPRFFWKELIKKVIVKRCSSYLCYGTKSKEYLIKLGANPQRIFIRCQATDNQTILNVYLCARHNRPSMLAELRQPAMNFIYVGRLSKEKNLICLLTAFKAFKQNYSNACEWGLIIVGDGPERAFLSSWVLENKVNDICFVGGKTWREVPVYYSLSDVFVLPSLSEPWGLVVNEAMVCGLPVIVSNKCGAAYDLVCENKNGFTFDPRDVNELVERLSYFANNKADIPRMSQHSLDIISVYSPKNAAKQMLAGILQ